MLLALAAFCYAIIQGVYQPQLAAFQDTYIRSDPVLLRRISALCVCLISSESWIRRWGRLISPYSTHNPFATYLRAPGPVYPNPFSD